MKLRFQKLGKDPTMNFSDKIKYQREQNHLTQKELAELVGVSQRAIAAYESSGTIARISTMRKLAHALNVSYDYLKHDEITDPSYGIEKMDYIDEVNGQLGEKGASRSQPCPFRWWRTRRRSKRCVLSGCNQSISFL